MDFPVGIPESNYRVNQTVFDLLGDKFEIKEFKDYVRVESLPSARSLVEAKEDEGGGGDEEEEEEAVVLNSKDIMEQLKRKGRK